jgi:hypothetical protein
MVSAGGDEAAKERRMFAKFNLWDALFPCASLNLGSSAVFWETYPRYGFLAKGWWS